MLDASGLPSLLPYVAGVVAALIVAVAVAAAMKPRARLERRVLLTRAELDLLAILRSHLPHHHVSCQVSMGALLQPKKGLSRKSHALSRNKVAQKVVDFVVMDPETGAVDAVIELDDSSHDARKDARRDALLAQGQYQVIRIPSKPRPTRENVAKHLSELRSRERR